jgi:hypothetical protein
MKLTDFNNLTNFGIEDPRMTTIAGVAFRHLDCLPKVGDTVTVEGIGITVLEMDGHRVSRVRVSRGSADAATEDAEGAEGEEDSIAADGSADTPADAVSNDKQAEGVAEQNDGSDADAVSADNEHKSSAEDRLPEAESGSATDDLDDVAARSKAL